MNLTLPRPALRPRAPRPRRRAVVLRLALAGAALWPVAPRAEADLAAALVQALNAHRAQRGLAPVQADAELTALASAHSRDMAQQRRLSHDGFEQRLDRSGRSLCVENLAAGYRQAQALLQAWQRSAAHRDNLVEPGVQRVGVGVVDGYVALLMCSDARVAPERPAGADDGPR